MGGAEPGPAGALDSADALAQAKERRRLGDPKDAARLLYARLQEDPTIGPESDEPGRFLRAAFFVELALALVDCDRGVDAAGALRQARALYRELHQPILTAGCDHDLTILRHQEGDDAATVRRLQTLRDVFIAARRPDAVAVCEFNLGIAFHDAGEYDEAVHSYVSARNIFETREDRENMAACSQNLGVVLADAERFDEARTRLQTARSIFATIGDERAVAECDYDLSVVLRALGRDDDAVHFAASASAGGVHPLN
jgi:tetratricopeptide (TPR) repeat protein